MTTAWIGEGQVAVFIAIDHHRTECVGIHATRRGTRFEALEPIRQGSATASARSARVSPTVSPSGTTTAAKFPGPPQLAGLGRRPRRKAVHGALAPFWHAVGGAFRTPTGWQRAILPGHRTKGWPTGLRTKPR